MSKKPKGKMFPKTAAMHAYRLWSLGRINGPEQHPDQMQLPLEVPAETGPRLLPYVLYAVADPDGTVTVPLSELCLMVGHAPRTVERWRARIRGLGFLAKVSNGNRYAAAVYLLTLPDWAASQMEERYPDTFEPPSRAATQDGASTTSQSASRAATQDGASTTGVQILEPPSERLEPPSPRSDCRLTEEEGDSLRSSLPPQPPRQRDPSAAAPDGADEINSEAEAAQANRAHVHDSCTCDPDVIDAAELLADLMVGNGRKTRPRVSCKGWHTPIRLMVTVDQLAIAEVVGAIRWAQADAFWCGVILSPAKLRMKYDALRLRAQAQQARHNGGTAGGGTSKLESAADLARRMRAEEATTRPLLIEGGTR